MHPIHKQSVKGSGVDNRYVGKEAFYWLYNISDTLSQEGYSSVAAIEYGPDNGFSVDDLQTAERLNNVSVTDIHHIIDRYEGSDVESQLDMQMMAINLGENSDVWYWNNDKWLYSLAIDMFNNQTIPDVISMSYGWAEDNQCAITSCGNITSQDYVNRVNTEYIKLGLRGVTIAVSSGDAGAPGRTSEGCDPSRPLNPAFPGSSPWITSVGATFVVANNHIHDWNSTLCKNHSCIGSRKQRVTNYNDVGWTSGGGVAKLSERFTMQEQAVEGYLNSGVSLPRNLSSTGRMFPDVSLIGHYCPVIDNGGLIAVDGTSCSCPLFASIVTLLNQHQTERGRPKLGYINPLLYMMYYDSAECFNDIEVGNNWCTEVDCCPLNERNGSDFGFKAAKGYDPVYGLGTPNVECMRRWLDRNT
jgi:tripeptidyl-peptidase-1